MIPGLTNMYANSLLISQQRVGSDRSRPSDEGRGGGCGHLDLWDKGCGLKIIFSAFGPHWSKNKGGTRAPLAPFPGSATRGDRFVEQKFVPSQQLSQNIAL